MLGISWVIVGFARSFASFVAKYCYFLDVVLQIMFLFFFSLFCGIVVLREPNGESLVGVSSITSSG